MTTSIPAQALEKIASTYGTPVYVYHAEKIKEQFQRLQHAFNKDTTTFFYAAKALTNISILRYINHIGCNVDCSSVNEVQLALHAGFEPHRILYTSNNISFEEIITAKELGVHINIDSVSNLKKFGERFGHSYPVGVRIRPNIMAGGNLKISTGHEDSKFGVPLEQVQEIIELVKTTNLHIKTLHIHTGSEIKDVAVFAKGLEVLFDIAQQFPEVEVIDLGGGFKVPYKPGETGTDIEELGRSVNNAFAQYNQTHNRQLKAWFEPGKFLVSEAGFFITRVTVLKENTTRNFAGVDTGLNHLIRPMFYGSYHEILNITNAEAAPKKYNVVGNICETDNFAEDRLLPEVREGDLLVFKNAGAYCFEMASNYNSRYKPAEVLWLNNQAQLIRRRDEMEDLLRNQVAIQF